MWVLKTKVRSNLGMEKDGACTVDRSGAWTHKQLCQRCVDRGVRSKDAKEDWAIVSMHVTVLHGAVDSCQIMRTEPQQFLM